MIFDELNPQSAVSAVFTVDIWSPELQKRRSIECHPLQSPINCKNNVTYLLFIHLFSNSPPCPGHKSYLLDKALTPGKSFPSNNSNDAPPPVDTWLNLSSA